MSPAGEVEGRDAGLAVVNPHQEGRRGVSLSLSR